MKLSFSVYGLSNKPAVINFWRQENFVLPAAGADPRRNIRTETKNILESADKYHAQLRKACELYAEAFLTRTRDDDRKRDKNEQKHNKKKIVKIIEQMPCSPWYWSRLEAAFRKMLALYPSVGLNAWRAQWLAEIRDALDSAWRKQEEAEAGGGVWTIRALVKAGDSVKKTLKDIKDELDGLRETLDDKE
jgi:hypothetical protein